MLLYMVDNSRQGRQGGPISADPPASPCGLAWRAGNYSISSLYLQSLQSAFIPGPDPWPRPGMARCGDGKWGIHKQWK